MVMGTVANCPSAPFSVKTAVRVPVADPSGVQSGLDRKRLAGAAGIT